MTLNQSQENRIVNNTLRKVPYPHITGMKLLADVKINGLTLNTADELTGIVWVCSDIDGWWDLPNADVPDIQRGLDDGSYDVRGRWVARSLTLSGSILVPDSSLSAGARDTFFTYISPLLKTGGWLIVNEPNYKKAAFVRLVGSPQVKNVNARGRMDFTIQLRAGDPIKYYWNDGVDPTDGYQSINIASSNTATNYGNIAVPAIIEISGASTAPSTIQVTNATSVSQVLKITRTLRASGFSNTNTATTVANKEASAGIATLTFSGAHGFFAGDTVTITNVTSFNQTNVVVTTATTTTISYLNPVVNISSVVITSNVATVTTTSAHGIANAASIYIKDCFNPLIDGVYTVTANTVSSNTSKFTFAKVYPNTTIGAGGNVSLQVASAAQATGNVALVGADTLKIDTYNGTVLYRGTPDNSRASLNTTVDWLKLDPGNSTVTFTNSGGSPTVTMKYRSGWIG
jgi:hypothetical protein